MGVALALRNEERLPWLYAACALGGAILIQIATNFINDALDFRKGTDTAERIGPTRVTQAGLLSDVAVMRASYVCLAGAALFGVPLVIRGGWPLLVIGLLSILLSYGYTGGPYPLAYHGLGELFVLLFFGVIAVGGTYYVLTLRYGGEVLTAGVAAGLLSVAILAINNLRDLDGDRASGKNTLAVRLGARAARAEIAAAATVPFLLVMALAVWLRDLRFLLPLLASPIAVVLIAKVYRSTGALLNRCLALASVLLWAFSVLFFAAFVI